MTLKIHKILKNTHFFTYSVTCQVVIKINLTWINPFPTIEILHWLQKKHSLCQASVSKATNFVLPSPPLPKKKKWKCVDVCVTFYNVLFDKSRLFVRNSDKSFLRSVDKLS